MRTPLTPALPASGPAVAQTGSAHVRAPYADAPMHLTTLWMLDDMTEEAPLVKSGLYDV